MKQHEVLRPENGELADSASLSTLFRIHKQKLKINVMNLANMLYKKEK